MGIIARYLDLLPQDAKDRVLCATQWTTHWTVADDGSRNLLGHAEDWSRAADQIANCRAAHVFRLRETAGDELWTDEPRISVRFDRLVGRCGMNRAVALIQGRVRQERPRPRIAIRRGPLMLLKE
jgi:hypothetical protein